MITFKTNIQNIFSKIQTTLIAKQNDYGRSYEKSIAKYGEVALLIRLEDKFNRLNHLMLGKKEAQVKEESIEDTLRDIIGYCVLELERREGNGAE